MKNKLLSGFICLFILCISLIGNIPVFAESKGNTVNEAQNLVDGIINLNLKKSGVNSVQSWINGSITKNAGISSEWYVLALSQSGAYNFSSYQDALKSYLKNNEVYSASSRQKYALILAATGSTDNYISTVMDNSIGQQGVMSWIYGLHLLNNGYVSSSYTKTTVKEKLLSLQLNSGGWAVTGTSADADVTAMAIQALSPYYSKDTSVKNAIDKAVSLLSSCQLKDGDFSSYGVANIESTAQVITALSSLGINCEKDSRFIKNGNTLLDGLKKYKLSDGSFCHKINGGSNDTATMQAFYSLVAYIRMMNGKGGLYILDNANPEALLSVKPTVTKKPSQKKATPTPKKENKSKQEKLSNIDKNEKSNVAEKDKKDSKYNKTSTQKSNKNSSSKNNKKQNTTPKPTTTDSQLNEQPTVNEEKPVETVSTNTTQQNNNHPSYKLWASLAVIVLGGIACIVLYITKKRNKKNFIFILIITALAVCFIFLTNFQSADNYYNGEGVVKENPVGTVTLTIRCNTIVGKSDSKYIPDNGIILDTSEFVIEEKDTVYDILTEAARKYNIQMENTGSDAMAYISGINYLYEFDFGDLSGWVYHVNGKSSDIGCSEYILSDGDTIEWLYTCELGNDLK